MTRASGPCIVYLVSEESLENKQDRSHGPEARVTVISTAILALVLMAAMSGLCWLWCGASLMLFLAGFFFLTPFLPPLVLSQGS